MNIAYFVGLWFAVGTAVSCIGSFLIRRHDKAVEKNTPKWMQDRAAILSNLMRKAR